MNLLSANIINHLIRWWWDQQKSLVLSCLDSFWTLLERIKIFISQFIFISGPIIQKMKITDYPLVNYWRDQSHMKNFLFNYILCNYVVFTNKNIFWLVDFGTALAFKVLLRQKAKVFWITTWSNVWILDSCDCMWSWLVSFSVCLW